MNNKKSLRAIAKKVFDEKSKRISDCFDIKALKNISVIYVPHDAPVWVCEIASFLKEQIELKYPETTVDIVRVGFLFSSFSYSSAHLEEICSLISAIQKSRTHIKGTERLLLCRTRETVTLIRMLGLMKRRYGQEFLPTVFLDVEAYHWGRLSAMTDVKSKIGNFVKDLEIYEPYWYRDYISADYLVVYASGSESWPYLIHVWHEIKKALKSKPQILYVDDLKEITSDKYSAKIFRKFSKFLRWMSVKNANVILVSSGDPEQVRDIVRKKNAIVFIPQLKTYLCDIFRKKLSLPGITFNICEKSFSEYWNLAGPIARQYFCYELLNFMTDWSESERNDFLKLFQQRSFQKWNLKFYWWNYRMRINNMCRQFFLSELGSYK